MKEIVIYSTPYCPFCHAAKNLLTERNLYFQEVDVSNDPVLREEMSEKFNWLTVPMITIDGKFIGGYDDLNKLYREGKLEKMV